MAGHLGDAMHREGIGIDNSRVAAMFIAQTCHESGAYRWPEELASGAEYEGRRDLGNTRPGDGRRFKGRGYIQVTGRVNYAAVGRALGHDFISHPGDLKSPKFAALSAAWWFKAHGLIWLSQHGSVAAVTRVINGGFNGLSSREAYFRRANHVRRWLRPR